MGFSRFYEIFTPPHEKTWFLKFFSHFRSPGIQHPSRARILTKLGTLILCDIPQVGFPRFFEFFAPPSKKLGFLYFFAIFVPPELHPSRAPILTILGTLILHLC